jgi:DNA polymerase-3 subunit alpha
MIALALYRPGPMTGGLKDTFVQRHLGNEEVKHIHPSLEKLLRNTYGVILYQEQVLRIASELAGLSLADADLLRRAMSHFDPGDKMKNLKNRFVEGARTISKVPEDIAEQIWDLMAAFSGYGFPKAHAASYAEVAWKSLWCKAHFPVEFMAAVLSGGGGYYRQHVYINEIRRLGIKLKPPHINHSGRSFSISYSTESPIIYMGLDQVRDLSIKTQEQIIANRPYHSCEEFLTKVDPNIKEVVNLIKVGAMDGFGKIPNLLKMVSIGGWRKNQPSLFPLQFQDTKEEWSLAERVNAQIEILGVGIDAHPVELKSEFRTIQGTTPIKAIKSIDGEIIKLIGIKQTVQRFHSSNEDTYYLLELDDSTGVLPVRISENMYNESKKIFSNTTPFLVEGSILFDKFTRMDQLAALRISQIY